MAEPTGELRLVVVTHDRQFLDRQCVEVNVPGREGDMGILPGHTSMLASLRPGVLAYRVAAGGTLEQVAIAAGFLEVSADSVTVLVDDAADRDEVDLVEARQHLQDAETSLSRATTEELEEFRDRVLRWEARVAVAAGR